LALHQRAYSLSRQSLYAQSISLCECGFYENVAIFFNIGLQISIVRMPCRGIPRLPVRWFLLYNAALHDKTPGVAAQSGALQSKLCLMTIVNRYHPFPSRTGP
jgi:hypothetical protein